jgi:hypothetical protein
MINQIFSYCQVESYELSVLSGEFGGGGINITNITNTTNKYQ